MLKQVVKYKDYNDVDQTDTLYFNVNRTELADLLDMLPRLEAFLAKAGDDTERDATIPEVKEILDIVQTLIRVAYGVRSEDGKHFRKSEELFLDFSQSAAYDAFVMSLFDNGAVGAMQFMIEVLPKDMVQEAAAANNATVVELPNDGGKFVSVDEKPATVGELSSDDFDDEQLLAMPKEEFEKLVGTDPTKMSKRELRIAFRKKSGS